jgi:hypothetical protein
VSDISSSDLSRAVSQVLRAVARGESPPDWHRGAARAERLGLVTWSASRPRLTDLGQAVLLMLDVEGADARRSSGKIRVGS